MSRNFPAGQLRVSDAERDRAIAELSEHFQSGRLTQAEFEERSGRALGARTGSELAGLFADLPAPDSPAPRHPLVAATRSRGTAPAPGETLAPVPPRAAGRRCGAAVCVLACVVAGLLISGLSAVPWHGAGYGLGHAGFGWGVPVLVAVIIVRFIARRRRYRGRYRN